MIKRILVACAACWALGAQSEPIVYTTVQYSTAAVAVAGGGADANFDSSPPTSLPLVTSAVASDGIDFAAGAAIADTGLLTAQAEASSLSGFTSAVGSSEFNATFSLGAYNFLKLGIDFLDQNFTDPGAFSEGTMFVVVSVDGVTILDRIMTVSELLDVKIGPEQGGNYEVDILLDSQASTSGAGNAFNFMTAAFNLSSEVPEPGTLFLFGAGLVGCVWRRRQPSV